MNPLEQFKTAIIADDVFLAAGLVDELDDEDLTLLAKACWETNNDTEAIRLMLDCGFPLGIPEHNHGYSPLHNAAWSGNVEVVRLLLEHGHPADLIDPQYDSSAGGYPLDMVHFLNHNEL